MLKTTLCYIFKEDYMLMMFRNKKENDFHEGKWNGLGGKFELGETPEQCICREVFEESGLKLQNPILIGECFFPNFQGDMVDEFMYLYRCDDFSGEVLDCAEGELHWVPIDQVLQLNIWDSDKIFLPFVIRNEKFYGTFTFNGTKLVDYDIKRETDVK